MWPVVCRIVTMHYTMHVYLWQCTVGNMCFAMFIVLNQWQKHPSPAQSCHTSSCCRPSPSCHLPILVSLVNCARTDYSHHFSSFKFYSTYCVLLCWTYYERIKSWGLHHLLKWIVTWLYCYSSSGRILPCEPCNPDGQFIFIKVGKSYTLLCFFGFILINNSVITNENYF